MSASWPQRRYRPQNASWTTSSAAARSPSMTTARRISPTACVSYRAVTACAASARASSSGGPAPEPALPARVPIGMPTYQRRPAARPVARGGGQNSPQRKPAGLSVPAQHDRRGAVAGVMWRRPRLKSVGFGRVAMAKDYGRHGGAGDQGPPPGSRRGHDEARPSAHPRRRAGRRLGRRGGGRRRPGRRRAGHDQQASRRRGLPPYFRAVPPGQEQDHRRGQRYIPYGITVTGLGNPNWKTHHAGDDAEIGAAAASWCSNTVRLQIFQYGLLGPGKTGVTVNTAFLGLIEGEVTTALKAGLDVVINDQTEGGGNPAAVGMPTTQTEAFWKVMSGKYGKNPDVIFDVFNEPRRVNFPTEAATWKFWQHGGNYHGRHFIGMQPLARYVRGLGASNLFWIEGPHTAGTLDEVVSHQITRAGPLEYAINHPGGVNVRHDSSDWYTRFGYAAKKVPMTDAEWTNYSSTRSCWANAPTSVPAFLS